MDGEREGEMLGKMIHGNGSNTNAVAGAVAAGGGRISGGSELSRHHTRAPCDACSKGGLGG